MRFSIGIPAYKARYFKECLESVFAQTFQDYELIILNDASPEAISDVVAGYHDSRLQYIENDKNVGALHVVDNWNKLLKAAQGDYFILMGDDDVFMPNYLESFDKLINAYPDSNIYHCRSMIIDENSKFSTLTDSRPSHESVFDCIWGRMSNGRTQFISDFVYKRDVLVANGGFIKLPLAWGTDDITAYKAAAKFGLVHTNDILFKYRRSKINISASTSNIEDKLVAADYERNWILDLMKEANIRSEEDEYLMKMISNSLDKYVLKKKMYLISKSMAARPLGGLFKWINQRKKFGVPATVVGYAFVEALKIRLTR